MSALAAGSGILAVDPVPWARAQTALTVARHVIVPSLALLYIVDQRDLRPEEGT
jgi:hypothetical protein